MTEPCLVWLDLETTGLDPGLDSILAVGVIVTTPRLEELSRHEWLIQPPNPIGFTDWRAAHMHSKSGLLERCVATGRDLRRVESDLALYLTGYDQDRHLAGSSVWFDRAFLAASMPRVLALLHKRQLDVSSLKLLARLWLNHERKTAGPPAHLPLADLENSIAELRHWQHLMFQEGIGPCLPTTTSSSI